MSERTIRLGPLSPLGLCDSTSPVGSSIDPIRGQLYKPTGHGLALPVRTEFHADTSVERCASGGMNVQLGVGNRAYLRDLSPSFLRATTHILSYEMSYKPRRELPSGTFPITHRRRSERCTPFDVFQIVPLGRTDNAEACCCCRCERSNGLKPQEPPVGGGGGRGLPMARRPPLCLNSPPTAD